MTLLHLRSAGAALAALALTACANWGDSRIAPLENYQPESFGAEAAHVRHYAVSPARACEAARRALLSQGYVVTGAAADQASGRKYFQPDPYHNVQLEFRTVCAPESADGHASMVFISGLKEQYLVRKAKESASLGVGAIGSLSLPIEGNLDSMVKVSSETVSDPDLYTRLFDLLEQYLEHAVVLPPPGAAPAYAAASAPVFPTSAAMPAFVAPAPPASAAAPASAPEPPASAAAPASAPEPPASAAAPASAPEPPASEPAAAPAFSPVAPGAAGGIRI